MKKQILTIAVAATLATSSLYAFGNCDKNKEQFCEQKQMKMHKMKMHKKEGFRSVMHALSQLDLSDSQWKEVKESILTMKIENLENAPQKKLDTFLTLEGFDKEGYIKQREAHLQTKLTNEAKMIQKVTDILTKEQLEAFIAVLQTPYQKKGKKEGKRCNK